MLYNLSFCSGIVAHHFIESLVRMILSVPLPPSSIVIMNGPGEYIYKESTFGKVGAFCDHKE